MVRRSIRAIASRPLLLFLCAVFFLIGILRLNDLSLYNPDSTRYLIWGNSLAQGHGYVDDTQPDPDHYVIHAPLYALLIAPAEFFWPLSTIAVKFEMIFWGMTAIILFMLWMERLLGKMPALVGAILLMSNPLFLIYSTEVLSELPFLAAALGVFILYERLSDPSVLPKGGLFFFLMFSLSFLPLLREVGLALVAAAAIFHFIRRQPLSALAIIGSSGIILGMWYVRNQIIVQPSAGTQSGNLAAILQHVATSENTSIVEELSQRIWLQAKAYSIQLGGMLLYPQYATQQVALVLDNSGIFSTVRSMFGVARYFVIALALPLMGYGIYDDLRKSRTALLRLLFVVFYLLGILLYPIHDLRFMFPLLPLVIAYIVRSVHHLLLKPSPEPQLRKQRLLILATIALMLPNISGVYQLIAANLQYRQSRLLMYLQLARQQEYPPMFAQPWPLIGNWIQKHTPPGAVIASPAKDPATMVGQRKILELDPGVPMREFERILRDNQVGYLVVIVRWQDFGTYEFLMTESTRFWFEPVYDAASLHVMKIHSRSLEAVRDEPGLAPGIDTVTVSGLLRLGRRHLVAGDCSTGLTALSRALELSPSQPEVIYQLAVGSALAGDASRAVREFRRLLALPQAGSYLYSTRVHLQALRLLDEARSATSPEVVDVKSADASLLYWNLGYPHRAAELLGIRFRDGSHHFVGLLWGFHFAYRRGDRAAALHYLERLRDIDTSNAVVKVFERIITLDDSLEGSSDAAEKSRFHLAKAKLYFQIELFEEAIDAGEQSVHEDSHNRESALFLGEIFQIRKAHRAALRFYADALRLNPGDAAIAARMDSLRHSAL